MINLKNKDLPRTTVFSQMDVSCLSKEQPITDKSRVSREANSPGHGLEIGATKAKTTWVALPLIWVCFPYASA
jgi:hypothetical protein